MAPVQTKLRVSIRKKPTYATSKKIIKSDENKEFKNDKKLKSPQKSPTPADTLHSNTSSCQTVQLRTPKRRLFSEADGESSPSKRGRSPAQHSTVATSSPATPSTLLANMKIIDSPKIKCDTSSTETNNSRRKKLFEPTDSSLYSSARQALHSSQPSHLPGREEQVATILNYLTSHLSNDCKERGALYVSGTPGTGKTASLTLALQHPLIKSGFKVTIINCTTVKTSSAIFSRVANELGIKLCGNKQKDFVDSIKAHVMQAKKKILLVLDEVDQLESKHQAVLYTIFELPSLPGSQLTLVGIANCLDLTDRLLPRLQARASCRPKLLRFAPYSKQQLSNILMHRLEEAGVSKVFQGVAVELLAAKVAAVSGDARRALDVGRRVVELVDSKNETTVEGVLTLTTDLGSNTTTPRKSPRKIASKESLGPAQVGISEVRKVLDSVYGTTQSICPGQEEGDGLPLQQKFLICSLLLMLSKGNTKDITVGKLHEVYSRVCSKRTLKPVSQSDFFNMCVLVETRGIIKMIKAKKEPRFSKISMQWDEEEVTAALCDKYLLSTILSDVSCLKGK